MYTNIETTHALEQLESFFTSSKFCSYLAMGPILVALQIVMTHNVFQFGDTWWVQLTGTAMGAPPPPAMQLCILQYMSCAAFWINTAVTYFFIAATWTMFLGHGFARTRMKTKHNGVIFAPI